MSTTCVVCNCSKNASEESSISFHMFPKDPKRRKMWIDALGVQIPSSDLDLGRICSSHFTSNNFKKSFNKYLLKNNSLPFRYNKCEKKQPTPSPSMENGTSGLTKLSTPNKSQTPSKLRVKMKSSKLSNSLRSSLYSDNDQMNKCCVKSCKNCLGNSEVRFYTLPLDNKLLLDKWLKAIGADDTFKVTVDTMICRAHFTDDDFISTNGITKVLPTAIPSQCEPLALATKPSTEDNQVFKTNSCPTSSNSINKDDDGAKVVNCNEHSTEIVLPNIISVQGNYNPQLPNANGITKVLPTAIPSQFEPLGLATKPSTEDNQVFKTNSCPTSTNSINKDGDRAKVVNCNEHSTEIVLPNIISVQGNYNPQLPNSNSSTSICDKSNINESDHPNSNVISPECYQMLGSIHNSFDYQYCPTYKLLTAFECGNSETDKNMPEKSKPLLILVSTKINENTGLPVDVKFVQKVQFKNIFSYNDQHTTPISINLLNKTRRSNVSVGIQTNITNHNVSQTESKRKYKDSLEEKHNEVVRALRELNRDLMVECRKHKTANEKLNYNYLKLKFQFLQLQKKFEEKTNEEI